MDRATEVRLANLLEILDAKGANLGERSWLGPVIGSDDEPDPSVSHDLVSDDTTNGVA